METAELIRLGEKYLMNTYSRREVVLVRGKGCRVWDNDGKEYLDFLAGIGVNDLGHCHPAIMKAVKTQVGIMIHCTNLYLIPPQVELARRLVEHSFADKAFFANTGAEVNEGAMKLARLWAKKKHGPHKYGFLTFENSFHGRTLATLTATGQEKFHKGFEPLVEGFRYAPFNDLAAAEAALGEETCAIIVEPVQGEGGVVPATKQFLEGLRRLCDERGLLLIFDEIQCGLGRTGKNFAYEHYGVEPDVMTLAKALAGGVPIGALLAKGEAAEVFEPGQHGTTFGGNPLACAAGLAFTEQLFDRGLANKSARLGKYFRKCLKKLAAQFPIIKEVRGMGLMIGVELNQPGGDIVKACTRKGLLINCTRNTVLRIMPPLIVKRAEIDQAVGILDTVLEETAEQNRMNQTG
ncbi:MAG: acetylornithine transaminase [bacterium]